MNTKRTHRLLSLAIALVMALSLLPTKAWGYNDLQGSGTEASPYLISSARRWNPWRSRSTTAR